MTLPATSSALVIYCLRIAQMALPVPLKWCNALLLAAVEIEVHDDRPIRDQH